MRVAAGIRDAVMVTRNFHRAAQGMKANREKILRTQNSQSSTGNKGGLRRHEGARRKTPDAEFAEQYRR